jgi:hypothetical protein
MAGRDVAVGLQPEEQAILTLLQGRAALDARPSAG